MRTLPLLALIACGGAAEPEGKLPDFTLFDVNPTSATYDVAVSPSDYSGSTAWYFGHAT